MMAKFVWVAIILQIISGAVHCLKSFEFKVTMKYRSPDCVERLTSLINGVFPGPTIQVTAGERVEIKVGNGSVF